VPGAPVGRPQPRSLWMSFEAVHAVTYFAPECRDGLAATGLRGFWMGYFAARAAPLGAVGPSAVTAAFFNFHPAMVGRAIPDAWAFAPPGSVLRARCEGAAAALRRIVPGVEREAEALVPLMVRVVDGADVAGRVLFAANRDLDPVADPVEALWQACTSLREHRGDGHVAALLANGLDGCGALVTMAAAEAIPTDLFRASRGWSGDEWESARLGLEARGLVEGDRITPAGVALRQRVEATTDRLAAAAFDPVSDADARSVADGLGRVARAVAQSGVIPFPNPIGLPAPDGA
jgi:hypothetical protein